MPTLSCGLRRGRATVLSLRSGDPVDHFLVLLDLADSSQVARYRRERTPMGCESSAQEVTVRHSLASSFLHHCHAACGEAAPPPALLEDERLRVLGDEFQQLDISPVAF